MTRLNWWAIAFGPSSYWRAAGTCTFFLVTAAATHLGQCSKHMENIPCPCTSGPLQTHRWLTRDIPTYGASRIYGLPMCSHAVLSAGRGFLVKHMLDISRTPLYFPWMHLTFPRPKSSKTRRFLYAVTTKSTTVLQSITWWPFRWALFFQTTKRWPHDH